MYKIIFKFKIIFFVIFFIMLLGGAGLSVPHVSAASDYTLDWDIAREYEVMSWGFMDKNGDVTPPFCEMLGKYSEEAWCKDRVEYTLQRMIDSHADAMMIVLQSGYYLAEMFPDQPCVNIGDYSCPSGVTKFGQLDKRVSWGFFDWFLNRANERGIKVTVKVEQHLRDPKRIQTILWGGTKNVCSNESCSSRGGRVDFSDPEVRRVSMEYVKWLASHPLVKGIYYEEPGYWAQFDCSIVGSCVSWSPFIKQRVLAAKGYTPTKAQWSSSVQWDMIVAMEESYNDYYKSVRDNITRYYPDFFIGIVPQKYKYPDETAVYRNALAQNINKMTKNHWIDLVIGEEGGNYGGQNPARWYISYQNLKKYTNEAYVILGISILQSGIVNNYALDQLKALRGYVPNAMEKIFAYQRGLRVTQSPGVIKSQVQAWLEANCPPPPQSILNGPIATREEKIDEWLSKFCSNAVATPIFSPSPDITYTAPVNVSITSTTISATIRYTKDSIAPLAPTDPVEASTKYTAPINVPVTTAFKAKAWKTGKTPSGIAEATYYICIAPACVPTLTSIEISPSSASIIIGEGHEFTATAKDQFGNSMSGITINWTSSNTAVATVAPAATTTTHTVDVSALALGTTTITATSGAISGTAAVTVIVDPCGNGLIDEDEVCDKNGDINCSGSTPKCNSSCTACVACISSCYDDCRDNGQPDTGCGGSCPNRTCNDFNSCTTDSCSSLTGCVFTNNSNSCDDGNLCTQTDSCSGGLCRGTNPKTCADTNDCTYDSCDPDTGNCTNSNVCGGLVPCGRLVDNPATLQINETAPCDLCSFFYMVKSLINYATSLALTLAILALVISGLLYATSAGDSHKLTLAKSTAYYALLGLFIIFLAWLIIAVILQALGYSGVTTWNQVNCVLR